MEDLIEVYSLSWMLGHTKPIAFSAIVWRVPSHRDQFDSMLRNAMIQFFNADVDVDKLCYIGDDGVPSVDLRRILMDNYKKIVEEGLKSYERLVPGRLWIILRAPTVPYLHHTTMTSCSLAVLAWANGHWCLSSPTCND